MSKALFKISITLSIIFLLCGCSSDRYSKEAVCKNLTCPYLADADFFISDKDKGISGSISIEKNDTVTVSFTQGDYEKIIIKGDKSGSADIFSFEFSGIPADVPKSITSEISLLFSLFSDEFVQKIKELPEASFRFTENTDGASSVSQVFFSENGMNYSLCYETPKGIPKTLSAGNDTLSISININDFKEITTQ